MNIELTLNLFGFLLLLLICIAGYWIGTYRERLEWKEYEWQEDSDADEDSDLSLPNVEQQVIEVLAHPSPPPQPQECGRAINGPIFCNLMVGHDGPHNRLRPAGTVIQ